MRSWQAWIKQHPILYATLSFVVASIPTVWSLFSKEPLVPTVLAWAAKMLEDAAVSPNASWIITVSLAVLLYLPALYVWFGKKRATTADGSEPSPLARIPDAALRRPFGRSTHVFWTSITNKLNEATEPSLTFHYVVVNAELVDIEIVGLHGSISLDGKPLGEPSLARQSHKVAVQGAAVLIEIVRRLTEVQATFLREHMRDHPRSKEPHQRFDADDLWLTIRHGATGQEGDVMVPKPGLFNA